MATFPSVLQLTGSPRIGGMGPDPLENPITRASKAAQPGASAEEQEQAANDLEAATPSLSPMAQPQAAALVRALRTNLAKTPRQRRVESIISGAPQALTTPSRTVELGPVPGSTKVEGPARLEQFELPAGTLKPGEREAGRIITSSGGFAKALIETAPVKDTQQITQFSAQQILAMREEGLDLPTIKAMNEALTPKVTKAGGRLKSDFPKEVNAALAESGHLPANIVTSLTSGNLDARTEAFTALQNAQQLVAQRIKIGVSKEEQAKRKAELDAPIGLTEGLRSDIFIGKKAALETGKVQVFGPGTSVRKVFAEGMKLKQKDIEALRNFGSALTLVDEIEDVGLRLFTSSDPTIVAWRGGEILTKKVLDQNPDIALWTSQGGLMFGLARALGNDSRISDADREFAAETAGLRNFQSAEGLKARMARLRRIMGSGKRRIFGQGPLRPPGTIEREKKKRQSLFQLRPGEVRLP